MEDSTINDFLTSIDSDIRFSKQSDKDRVLDIAKEAIRDRIDNINKNVVKYVAEKIKENHGIDIEQELVDFYNEKKGVSSENSGLEQKSNKASKPKEKITNNFKNVKKQVMKNLRINFFKISLIILISAFIYVFYLYSQNGRYRFSDVYPDYYLDTRTGTLYNIDGGDKKITKSEIPK